MKKKSYRILSFIVFLVGLLFLINPQDGITGAVIGVAFISSGLSSIVGLSLIFVAGFLFVAGDSLEYKIKHEDPKIIKSFRRWLEKKENIKITNQEAEGLYEKFEQKYLKAVGKGLIKKIDKNDPLKSIENFIEKNYQETKELLEDFSARAEAYDELNEAAQYLSQRRVPTKTKELKSVARACGYYLEKGRDEGTLVRDRKDGNIITNIPNHKEIDKDVARGIMKELATGKSTFRKYV